MEILRRVGELADLRVTQAETHEALGGLHAHHGGVQHGDADQPRQLLVVAAEAGTGEDHDFGAVLADDRSDLLRQLT